MIYTFQTFSNFGSNVKIIALSLKRYPVLWISNFLMILLTLIVTYLPFNSNFQLNYLYSSSFLNFALLLQIVVIGVFRKLSSPSKHIVWFGFALYFLVDLYLTIRLAKSLELVPTASYLMLAYSSIKFQIVSREIFFPRNQIRQLIEKKKYPWIGILIFITCELIGLWIIVKKNGFKDLKVNATTATGIVEVACLNIVVLANVQFKLVSDLIENKGMLFFLGLIFGTAESIILYTIVDKTSSSLILWFLASVLKNISLFDVIFLKSTLKVLK